jgi:hypothetical protein
MQIQSTSDIKTSNGLTPTRCALPQRPLFNMIYEIADRLVGNLNPSSITFVNVSNTRTNVPSVQSREPVPSKPACSFISAYSILSPRFSSPSSGDRLASIVFIFEGCFTDNYRRRGSSSTAFLSFLPLPVSSPFLLLSGKKSTFCVGLSDISLSCSASEEVRLAS